MYIITSIISLIMFLYVWLRRSPNRKRVCIVVLGDIGRSPRMQYHAMSFAQCGYLVDVVGYAGSIPDAEVVSSDTIKLHHIIEPPILIKSLPKMAGYIAKASWQFIILFIKLCALKRPQYILLQNPPSIPTMFAVWSISRVRSSSFVLDWHNYGYSILALTLGSSHRLVKIAQSYERYFGSKADANICVTNAMRDDLKTNWGVSAVTHYDRPPVKFHKASLNAQHALYVKLAKKYDIFKARSQIIETDLERTSFTVKQSNGKIHALPCRPALIVSSTSWTEDEDFSILLNALDKYETTCETYSNQKVMLKSLPNLACVITGKGPMKEHYMEQINSKDWKYIKVCTPWLEAEDYPILLGSADVGVCLHTSSSGLDLPMKVVDMFGCGLPVCAVCFKCLPELVKHEENGMIFHCASELSQQMEELLEGYPSNCSKLRNFRNNLVAFQAIRWHDSWKENVLPIFN